MPANSFSLYATARNISEQLRKRIESEQARGGPSHAELESALEEIQVLWEELHNQSASLADERQRYAEFFEYAPEPYLITEPLGEIREANRAACELFRERADALEGQLLLDRIPGDERPLFRAKLISVRGQPEAEPSEWTGALNCAAGVARVLFRVRSIKVRRKNAEGLCWLLRRLDHPTEK